MEWLIKLWNWLYGNKTILGTLILTIAGMVPEGISVFGLFDLKAALLWLGGILAGVGVAHRVVRSNTEPESPK
jgi:hypothetical protein